MKQINQYFPHQQLLSSPFATGTHAYMNQYRKYLSVRYKSFYINQIHFSERSSFTPSNYWEFFMPLELTYQLKTGMFYMKVKALQYQLHWHLKWMLLLTSHPCTSISSVIQTLLHQTGERSELLRSEFIYHSNFVLIFSSKFKLSSIWISSTH